MKALPSLIARKANQHLFWVILLLLLASLPVTAWALRQNNLRMLELRDQVLKIDQDTGDIKQIEPALLELRAYILTHMNSDMAGPLELPGSYNKSIDKLRKDTGRLDDTDAALYNKAIAHCEQTDMPLALRAQCVQEYVLENTPRGRTAKTVQFPPKEQFVYDFAAPRWSADIAGFSVLATIALLGGLLTVGFMRYTWPRVRAIVTDDPLE